MHELFLINDVWTFVLEKRDMFYQRNKIARKISIKMFNKKYDDLSFEEKFYITYYRYNFDLSKSLNMFIIESGFKNLMNKINIKQFNNELVCLTKIDKTYNSELSIKQKTCNKTNHKKEYNTKYKFLDKIIISNFYIYRYMKNKNDVDIYSIVKKLKDCDLETIKLLIKKPICCQNKLTNQIFRKCIVKKLCFDSYGSDRDDKVFMLSKESKIIKKELVDKNFFYTYNSSIEKIKSCEYKKSSYHNFTRNYYNFLKM